VSDQKQYVLYHDPCQDGFAAAYVAWTVYGDEAEYVPVKYGNSPPAMEEGSQVLIVDFSYPRDVLEEMAHRYYPLEVLDHHKTAQEDLEGLPYATFDMNRSGAVMTWDWFYPHTEPPKLLLYVQDRDLWKWDLPDSKKFNAAIACYPKEFPVWAALVRNMELEPRNLLTQGAAILQAQGRVIEGQCKEAQLQEIAGHMVPVVNATAHISEVGHELLERFPDCRFSASYRDTSGGLREWSLRSRGDFDVSEVAKKFGGGGHASAAGFREETE
jgi:uncharacterized protein